MNRTNLPLAHAFHPPGTTMSQDLSVPLRRTAINATSLSATVPSETLDVLRSPGTPLDPATRGDMERCFGHDFSQVRIHTDARAGESAHALRALAYTVGREVVFAPGRYAPATSDGRTLLAHELTHVIQQSHPGASCANHIPPWVEREAQRAGAAVAAGAPARIDGRVGAVTLQRAEDNAVDKKAKKIIDAGKDASKSIDQRAIDAVNAIVKAYYDPSLVESVVYDEKEPGLAVRSIGIGKATTGRITVGKYFIENIDAIARRVLQVGHELQHIQQQRAGMGGPAKKNEREFLAFYWEATQPEKAGTGRMPHANRVVLIDGALQNYYCMPEADQVAHAEKKGQLLKLRESEEKASKRDRTVPPSGCKKS